MSKRLVFICLFLFLALQHSSLIAEVPTPPVILPKEGASLNYRIIGFSFPPVKMPKGANCRLEIASGIYNDLSGFKNNIIAVHYLHTNKAIIEVPAFGAHYTWRVLYSDKSLNAQFSGFHHFTTAINDKVDTALYRMRILQRTFKYRDAYIFIDGSKALYDMNGKPVWFLPDIDSAASGKENVRDMKLSANNTITFIRGQNAYEIDYDGHVLWKGPDDGKVSGSNFENYHHQVNRLKNGHYLTLGDEVLTDDNANGPHKRDDSRVRFGTVIEYDKTGKLVWHWKSSSFYKKLWQDDAGEPVNAYRDVHLNSFFFDENKKHIYLSFKNTSQVIKLKYPEGKVLAVYGTTTDKGSERDYCFQHACSLAQDGSLFLFDNNTCNSGAHPRIVVLQETAGPDHLKKVWDFECPQYTHCDNTVGGNVSELTDKSFFISTPEGGLLIVGKDKKIRWHAVTETKLNSLEWTNAMQYRASIIKGAKDLNNLIWSGKQVD